MKDIKRIIKVCHLANTDMAVYFLLLNQLKELIKEGYQVSVVCSSGSLIKEIEKENISVEKIGFKRGTDPISHLFTLVRLLFYFKKEKFDIVHTHTPVPGFLGQIAAKLTGAPIIINTLHGFYFQETDSYFKKKFFIFLEKIAAFCSNLIFSQNREDIKTAIKEKICPPQKIKYLGNGIDLRKFNPDRFSEEFIYRKKKELNLDSTFKIIGTVGRLVKEKGYLELFEAFKNLIEKFPNTILLVVGPTEPEKKDALNPDIIKNYGIEKNVIFLGLRGDTDEIYSLMDIFVLPSHREGFPRTIIEASAMEIPVVASNIRGCREAIEDGVTGILVPLKDPKKLAEALLDLLSDPKKAKQMGIEGRKKALKEFDEEIIFAKIKKEYQELIKKKIIQCQAKKEIS